MDIEAQGISFSYPGSQDILRDVSFSVESGNNLVILGPSGCGKSTLLRIVAGLITKSVYGSLNGRLFIDNQCLISNPNGFRDLKDCGEIGYLFQEPILFENLNLEDNVALPSRIVEENGKAPINKTRNVSDLLSLVNLFEHKNKYPEQLSGGMKTRASIARLFSTKPKLLLLDEPFSAIDIGAKSSLYSEFHKLNRVTNTTAILVTHDIFEAIVFSQNICLLNNNGKSTSYLVEDWSKFQSYSKVIEKYKYCFDEIMEKISA